MIRRLRDSSGGERLVDSQPFALRSSSLLSHKSDPRGPLVRALCARAGILLLINQRILPRESKSLDTPLLSYTDLRSINL